MDFELQIKKLGLVLPEPQSPIANYVSVRQSGDLLFLSGAGPLVDGKPKYVGKLGRDLSVEEGYAAARLTGINIVAALKKYLGDLNRVDCIVKLLGFVACAEDFYSTPAVVNGASDLLVEVFGESGKHARSAVSAPSLPMNTPVEIEAIVRVKC